MSNIDDCRFMCSQKQKEQKAVYKSIHYDDGSLLFHVCGELDSLL